MSTEEAGEVEEIGGVEEAEEAGGVEEAKEVEKPKKIDPATIAVLCHDNFPIAKSDYGQSCIRSASTMLLGLRASTLSRNRGIKIGPGQTYRYGRTPKNADKTPKAGENEQKSIPEKKRSLYIYEAGVDPNHAETLANNIKIYVKRDGEKVGVVGTLSPAHPSIPLELTLSEDCELSHGSTKKAVFFNGCSYSLGKTTKLVAPRDKSIPPKAVCSKAKSVTLEANKEYWIAEVHPSQKVECNGKEYHLREVYSKENTNKSITLNACCNGTNQLLGELPAGCNRIKLNAQFVDAVELSHSSESTSVFFCGYTVTSQYFKLKELSEYTDSIHIRLKSSPKVSLDPEYACYKAKLAKGPRGKSEKQPSDTSERQSAGQPKQQASGPPIPKQPEDMLASHLTAPLIFHHQTSYQLISANPRGLFWVPNQEGMESAGTSSTNLDEAMTYAMPGESPKLEMTTSITDTDAQLLEEISAQSASLTDDPVVEAAAPVAEDLPVEAAAPVAVVAPAEDRSLAKMKKDLKKLKKLKKSQPAS